MAFSRPKKCFVCEKKAKGELARPDTCKNHWFHKDCLMEFGLRQKKCPIDLKEFTQIVGEDGHKVDICKRKDSSSSSSSSDSGTPASALAGHLAALSLLGALANAGESSNFTCTLCGESSGGERAKPSTCGHEFHRSCLLMHSRKENLCPKSGCRAEYQVIKCQNGDVLRVENNDLQKMLSAIAAGGSFTCRLCHTDDATRERAKAKPCGHEFHRGCLIERARRNNNCPLCNATIREINCMFGPDLSVGDSGGSKVECRQS